MKRKHAEFYFSVYRFVEIVMSAFLFNNGRRAIFEPLFNLHLLACNCLFLRFFSRVIVVSAATLTLYDWTCDPNSWHYNSCGLSHRSSVLCTLVTCNVPDLSAVFSSSVL